MNQVRSIGSSMKVATLVLITVLTAPAQQPQQPALSKAEQAVVDRQIAKVKGSTDRKVIAEWSNAKLVGEFICRPAALQVLKKKDASVDRVFLGTDDPSTLVLESAARLTGSGQYRYSQGWNDITFTCDINPETGKVTTFQSAPAQNSGAH